MAKEVLAKCTIVIRDAGGGKVEVTAQNQISSVSEEDAAPTAAQELAAWVMERIGERQEGMS